MPNLPPDHMYRIRVKDQFGKTLEGVPVDVSYQCDSSGSVILKSDKSGLAEFQCNPSWSDNKYYHYRSIVEVKLDGLDKESSNLIKVKKQVVGKQYEMEEINLVKIIPILRSYQIKAVDIEGNPISGTSVSYHISGLDSRDMSGVKLTDDKGVVLVIAEFENELSKWTPSKIKFATNRNGYYDSYGDLTNSWDGVSENGQTEKITVVMKSYKDYVDYKLQNLSKLVETERFKKLILHFQSLSAFLGFGLEENKEGNYFKIKLFQPVDKVSSNEYLASASLARDAVIPTLKFIENEFGFEQIFKYFDGVYFDINQGGLAFGYFIPSSDVNGFINLDITQQELLDASLVIYNGGRIKIELKK
jgi:hypothetical protein